MVAVHLEEAAELLARVGAAEPVRAEHDVAARHVRPDLLGERPDVIGRGAGRFLEIIFEALEIRPEESAEIANRATRCLTMSSQCAVFAESEVVSLLNGGETVADITDAIFQTLATNVATLSKKLKTNGDFVVGGGLANNQRILCKLQDLLRRPLHVFRPEPDFIAAVGAALCADGAIR